MAKIDYRSEVDSGFDRKRIEESILVKMLKEGVPSEIILDTPYFNFRHLEMIRNIKKGYLSKEEQISELYHRYGIDPSENAVSDNYSGVAHPISGELYPMEKAETTDKFEKLRNYEVLIEKLKVNEKEDLKKRKKSLEHQMIIFEYNNPLLASVINLNEELDSFEQTSAEPLSKDQFLEMLNKNGLKREDIPHYEKIYKEYIELTESLNKVTIQYEAALDSKSRSQRLRVAVQEKKELEAEIVQRNIKLVNGFIRQKYSTLLVETEDFFQVCCGGLWKAVQKYNPEKGTFSTYAYACMEREVQREFKNLTGYDWSRYWVKESIRKMINSVSNELGREVSLEDIYLYGLLNVPYKRAKILMRDYYSASDVSITDEEYKDLLTDQEYNYAKGEDEPEDIPSIFEKQPEEFILEKQPEEELDKHMLDSDLKMRIWKIMDKLKPREKEVLILRYGLDGTEGKTLKEVGEEINVSCERVRQIEAKALRKLRHPSRSKELRDYLEL